MNYNPQKIERKWQRVWEKLGIYKASDKVKGKKNFYSLVMFPYPSGDLHIGHWLNFVGGDVYSRFKKMQGFNVLHPIGFDAFGLPAENAAIKRRIHPKVWTYKNIQKMRKQLKSIGTIYDWQREVITSDPEYYKWTQWLFLQFYKAGLVYKTKVPANFCSSCKTVLANEQVVEGKCERCESIVVQKEIEQWLFKITDYTEDLLKDLENLDWPEATKIMQRNWIGKSDGYNIKFEIRNSKFETNSKFQILNSKQIEVFTTRIDTLFGCTYLVVAPEHSIIENFKDQIKNYKFVKDYIEESKKKTERERISEVKEKTGIQIKGIKAINPANEREIPIWVADYVLIHYGTGAIMAVPAHDQRDRSFAKQYNLPIVEVISPEIDSEGVVSRPYMASTDKERDLEGFEKAYEGSGILINSGRFTGMKSEIAKERIGEWLAKKGLAKKAVYFKLKDWLISRQRYWGAPIPMIYCQRCGWQSTPDKDLPVLLPKVKDYLPVGEGKSPLAKSKKFIKTICPKCNGPAERETDTMDTFVCSSWYYLAYAFWHKLGNQSQPVFNGLGCPTLIQGLRQKSNKENIFIKYKNLIGAWLPVDMYIGGKEHITLHLLYARFFTKALKGSGYLNFKEPFLALRHQGIILGPDGQKMSKSKGNIVEPESQLKKYGTDVLRLHLCFMVPYEQGGPWNSKGIEGMVRFLRKVFNLANQKQFPSKYKTNVNLEKLIHKTIKKVTEDIENFRFNTAISSLMILVNQLIKSKEQKTKNNLKTLLLLLAPFAPHLAEELWQKHFVKITPKESLSMPSSSVSYGAIRLPTGQENKKLKVKNSIYNQSWPKYNPKLFKEETITLIIQVNGKVRDKIETEVDISEKRAGELVLSRQKVQKWIEGKKIKKVIFVPGKLINIVI